MFTLESIELLQINRLIRARRHTNRRMVAAFIFITLFVYTISNYISAKTTEL
jgi:hypothetical protein